MNQPSRLRTAVRRASVPIVLAAACLQARADALPFYDLQFDASVIAQTSGGNAGFDSLSGVLGSDAVTLSTDSSSQQDIATAGAIVAYGLLSTSADIAAASFGSAVASAHFSAAFPTAGPVSLQLGFSKLDSADGTGDAQTTLYVTLSSGGVTLFSDYVSGDWNFSYTAPPISSARLDLTLTSQVSAAFPASGAGSASSFGLVSIAGTVPESSTALLLGLGLVGVLLGARRRHWIQH